MISRRTALGSAFAVGGIAVAGLAARRADVLDDGLRAIGLRPHAEPDPRDVQLLAEAAADQRALIAEIDALRQEHHLEELAPLRSVLADQLAAVSDGSGTAPVASSPDDPDAAMTTLADKLEAAETARAAGALAAGSLAVTQVLASMSAGLGQVGVAVRAS